MSVFSNIRGSLYPSFQIGKAGVTIYQGTSTPSNGTGISGDFYIQQNGTASLSYIKQGTAWISNITAISVSGDVSGSGNASLSLTLGTSGVTAGTYGSGLNYPQIIVDAKGRITSATTVALGSMAGQGSNSVVITGGTITGLSNPVASSDVATKAYVDAAISGLNTHPSVDWATTASLNGTYSVGTTGADGGTGVGGTITRTSGFSGFTPDGTTASVGDRILVKDQATLSENGIYVVSVVGGLFTAWVLTRASDYDNHTIATDVSDGDFTFVTKGSTNADSGWIQVKEGPIVIDTNDISFTQFSGAGQITAGTGLAKAGNTLSIGTNAVSSALFRQSSSNTLVGNSLGSTANVQDIVVGAGLNLSSGTLSVIGDGTGSVTSITAGTDLTGGTITNSGTLNLGTTGVTAGTYGGVSGQPVIVVDSKGRITNVTLVSRGTMSQQDSNNVNITGGTITGMSTPISLSDVATKGYVDNLAFGLNVHPSCELATTGTLSATYTAGTAVGADGGYGKDATLTSTTTVSIQGVIDSYSGLIVGDRILVKDQTDQKQNGIYVVSNLGGTATNWVLTRATDADNYTLGTQLDAGDFVLIIDGTINKATSWVNTTEGTTVIGTTNIVWSSLSANQSLYAGTGISISAGTISVGINGVQNNLFRKSSARSLVGNTAGSLNDVVDIFLGTTLDFVSGSLQTKALTGDVTTTADSFTTTLGSVNSNAGTFVAVTVGTKGLVTAATNLVASGDVSGTSSGATISLNLGSVVAAGTYNQIVVGTKGIVTSGTYNSPATVAGNFSPGATANAGTNAQFYSVLAPKETVNTAISRDILYAIPVLLPSNFPITRLGFQLTTVGAVSSVLRLGIYSNDSLTGLPKNLLVDAGTVDIRSSTGMKEIVTSYTTTGEWIWLVAIHNSTSSPSILGFDNAGNGQNLSNLLGRALSTGSATGFISAAFTFGTLGATFPGAVSYGTTNTPFLWARSV